MSGDNAGDAEQALDVARKRHEQGDDAGALKMAEKSLRIFATDAAQKLADHIRKFGEGSEMAAAARRVMDAADLYEVLQLERTCPAEDVKKAYHRMSKAIHPDKNKSRLSEEAFKRLGEAHNTLGDPVKRQQYDLKLPLPQQQRGRSRGASGARAEHQPPPQPPPPPPPRAPEPSAHGRFPSGEEHLQNEVQRLRRENDVLRNGASAKEHNLTVQVQTLTEQQRQLKREHTQTIKRLRAEHEEAIAKRGRTEAMLRQSVQKEKTAAQDLVGARDMARQVAADLHAQMKQNEARHAQELEALRAALRQTTGGTLPQLDPLPPAAVGDAAASSSSAASLDGWALNGRSARRSPGASPRRSSGGAASMHDDSGEAAQAGQQPPLAHKKKRGRGVGGEAAAGGDGGDDGNGAAADSTQEDDAGQRRKGPRRGTDAASSSAEAHEPPTHSTPSSRLSSQAAGSADEEGSQAGAPPIPANASVLGMDETMDDAAAAPSAAAGARAASSSSSADSTRPELVLTPLTPGGRGDGRHEVRLALHVIGQIALGRHSREHPNPWGVRDPRVSRTHVHLRAGPPEAPTVTAMGANPVLVISAKTGQHTTLKKGQSAPLDDGDQVHLVVEETIAPSGRSSEWGGNPCAYRVDIVSITAEQSQAKAAEADQRKQAETFAASAFARGAGAVHAQVDLNLEQGAGGGAAGGSGAAAGSSGGGGGAGGSGAGGAGGGGDGEQTTRVAATAVPLPAGMHPPPTYRPAAAASAAAAAAVAASAAASAAGSAGAATPSCRAPSPWLEAGSGPDSASPPQPGSGGGGAERRPLSSAEAAGQRSQHGGSGASPHKPAEAGGGASGPAPSENEPPSTAGVADNPITLE